MVQDLRVIKREQTVPSSKDLNFLRGCFRVLCLGSEHNLIGKECASPGEMLANLQAPHLTGGQLRRRHLWCLGASLRPGGSPEPRGPESSPGPPSGPHNTSPAAFTDLTPGPRLGLTDVSPLKSEWPGDSLVEAGQVAAESRPRCVVAKFTRTPAALEHRGLWTCG